MKILFVHQGFPGQYRHIIASLASNTEFQLYGLGLVPRPADLPSNVLYFQYSLNRGNSQGIHDLLIETESKVIRAEACAKAAKKLHFKGLIPDLICAHPGWGESLFLNSVWPTTPLLTYQEFFYNTIGFDYGFDPEFPVGTNLQELSKLSMKNANILMSLNQSSWSVTPTLFQKKSFPDSFQNRISCIHDGINVDLVKPLDSPPTLSINGFPTLSSSDLIISFVNRTLEPYRGFHTFTRSIPLIQKLLPSAHIVIVGSDQGVSYGALPPSGNWKSIFLSEIEGSYKKSNVHFVGSLPYHQYLQLLQITSCHVYLTYPFVLSWSLLEAMSACAPIVASKTEPVEDFISHAETGLLVDFFSPSSLAENIFEVVTNKTLSSKISKNARSMIQESYSLEKCVPNHISLMNLVANNCI